MLKFLARKIGSATEELFAVMSAIAGLVAILHSALPFVVSAGTWRDITTGICGFAVVCLAAVLVIEARERSEAPMSDEELAGWHHFWYHHVTYAITDRISTAASAVFIAIIGAIVGTIVGLMLGTIVVVPSPLPWWDDGHAYMVGLMQQCAVAGATLLLALCAWETYGEVPFTRWRERHHAAA